MKGEDFIRQILEGQRDFYGIELEYNFDLSGHELFGKMQEYLRKQYLAKYPIIISNSDLSGVKAVGLYLPYAKIESSVVWNANFDYATLSFIDFQSTDFTYSVFRHADLKHTDLRNANLQNVDFTHANLYFSDLRGANFDSTKVLATNLILADMKGVRNLERSLNLRSALFGETKVTAREESIIKHYSADSRLLDVES